MKKYLLLPVLLLSLLCGATSVFAYTNVGLITECAEKEGWTYSKLSNYPTVEKPGEDPVGYYNTFFKIWHCFRNEQWNYTTAVFWVPTSWFGFKQVSNFARAIDFPTDSNGYFLCFDTDECKEKDMQCGKACGNDSGPNDPCGQQCVKKNMECGDEIAIRCEGELEAWAMAYARKLAPEKKEPECDPSEYLVDGRCQHIFELCGRDALFTYNVKTGECSCPNLYIPMDGKCIHEDDLYPPDEPPPTPPPSEKPPVGDTPLTDNQDFPPDDPRNMFCQPPEGAESMSYNEFGIPIANAQIYSNYSVLTHVEGDVLIWTTSTKQWAPAFKGQRMTIGDKIKTGRNGRAEAKFANSAIFRMRPLSQLEIPDHKNSCSCHLNHRVGYLDMKFGKVWSREKPVNSECGWSIKTPTAIAGGSERGRPMYDYYDNDEFKVAYDVFEIPLASAEDGDTILHASHDEATKTSRFYVEKGEVSVSDINDTASVVLSSGETMSVAPDTVPHEMDIQPAKQVTGQWWETWEDDSSLSIWIPIFLYIGGMVYVIRRALKSNKGVFRKIGIFVLGFILINFIVGILMLFV